MVVIDRKIYLYGGIGNEVSGSMNIFEIDYQKWELYEDSSNNEGRLGHVM